MNLVDATERAIAAAGHLTDMDVGAIEALRALARKIQAWDRIVAFALKDAEENGGRPAVPQNDNVSLSAYTKLCDSLGLSPAGRKALELKEARSGGKLAAVRALKPSEATAAKSAAGVRVRKPASVHAAVAKVDGGNVARVRSDPVRGGRSRG